MELLTQRRKGEKEDGWKEATSVKPAAEAAPSFLPSFLSVCSSSMAHTYAASILYGLYRARVVVV